MFSVEVEAGEYEVLITSDKIEDIKFKFKVEEYEEYKKEIEAKPATRVSKIITDPPRARVYVDGKYLGDTLKFIKVEVGKRVELRIEKEGYATLKKTLSIARKGEVVEKNYKLNAFPEKPRVIKPRDGEEELIR